MMRFCILMGLAFANLILFGCSNWHHVDLAQVRQSRPTTAEPSRHVKASSMPVQAKSTQATVFESVGVASKSGVSGESREIRPWPKVGTPEWEQLQAEEIERERRAKDALRSIC